MQIVDPPLVVSPEGSALEQGSSVGVVLFGAGPDYPEGNLCYGLDGTQDDRQVRLEVGDHILMLANYESRFPIVNLTEPVLVLGSPPFGIWKIEADGSTKAQSPAYELDVSSLLKRIESEIRAGLIPLERLPATDVLSTPPRAVTPASTSTTAPSPPGVGATNSPTVTTRP